MNLDIKQIAENAFNNTIKEAINQLVMDHMWGNDSDIKIAIKEKVKDMIEHDVEIQKLIRDNLIKWITKN